MPQHKYRLRAEWANKKRVVVVGGRGYLVDNAFHNRNPNADDLIENAEILADMYEANVKGESGLPVELSEKAESKKAPKPKPKAKPKRSTAKKTK